MLPRQWLFVVSGRWCYRDSAARHGVRYMMSQSVVSTVVSDKWCYIDSGSLWCQVDDVTQTALPAMMSDTWCRSQWCPLLCQISDVTQTVASKRHPCDIHSAPCRMLRRQSGTLCGVSQPVMSDPPLGSGSPAQLLMPRWQPSSAVRWYAGLVLTAEDNGATRGYRAPRKQGRSSQCLSILKDVACLKGQENTLR